MSDPTYLVLVVLHIACAATMFGIALPVGSALRNAATAGREVKAAAAAMANRVNGISGLFGVLTIAFGLALVFYRGGFKAVPPTMHGALGLVLIMLVMGAVFERPTVKRLTVAADKSDEEWAALRKRYAMGNGILQLLWLVSLVLMFAGRA